MRQRIMFREKVAQKLLRDTVAVYCVCHVSLSTSVNLVGIRDSDTIPVLPVWTRACDVFEVCAVRPYAGRFLVVKPEATIVKAVRL